MIWREVAGATTSPRAQGAAVVIGTFDGVHRGHQAVLQRTAASGPPVVAVTFDPHPAAIFAPDRVPTRLTSLERRVELLRQHGADEVRVLAFSREMATWTPEQFVQIVLVDQLRATDVVVGENFRFGAKAAGTVETLVQMGSTAGFTAEGLDLRGDGDVTWSSTMIRGLVADRDMAAACAALGRPHEVVGTVVRGEQRGRSIGYPTANTPIDDAYAVPPDGVYAGHVVRGTDRWPAAISIGTNPTFGEHERRVESYVLDRPGGVDGLDLYGQTIRVELAHHLRPMVAFDGLDPLLEQMAADVQRTRELMA